MPTSPTPAARAKVSEAGRKAAATRTRNAAAHDARVAAEAVREATEAEVRVRATQVRHLAERTVDFPVGVGLVARDTLVSTVRGFATTLSDRARRDRVGTLIGDAQRRLGSAL